MSQPDWSKFAQKIYISASLRTVYEAWTTRTNLERWFLRKAQFTMPGDKIRDADSSIQKGDTYEWMWHGHPDTTVERGVVTDANGTDRFRFVFGKAGIVTISLKKVGNDTELILTQEHIPTDDKSKYNYYMGCSTGWAFYMANIKSVLEGGADLRNKNPEYSNVINS